MRLFLILIPFYLLAFTINAQTNYSVTERRYAEKSNFEEAVRLEEESLKLIEKIYGKNHPDYANSLNNLASYNADLGNYQEAIRLGTEALKIQEDVLGKNHPDYAIYLNNLASYNADLGNYQEAIRLGTQALNIREELLGKNHPDCAASLINLALYNSDLGNYQEVIRLGMEVLKIQEEFLGKNQPDLATTLSGLAYYNANIGNYQEAIRYRMEALKIQEEVLGKNDPDYAISLSSIAYYYYNLGNYQEAIRLVREALKIREEVLGKNHPDYANSLSNLANLNSKIGNYQEAIRLVKEALKIQEKVLGTNHPDYATSLDNLAGYNSNLGNYQEAIRLGTEALEIREVVLSKNHPDYATSLNNLAAYNSNLGNYQEAIRLGTEALEICEEILGKNHPNYATSLSNLANYNSNLGNYQEAIRLGTEALEIYFDVLGSYHPDYSSSLVDLSRFNYHLWDFPEAIRLVKEALKIQEEVLGKNHPNYAISLSNLANYNSNLGNYQEAIRLGTEALEICEEILGKNHPDYATYLSNLANYNSNLGNYQEAIRLGTEALEICEEILGKNHPNYANYLSNLSTYFASINDIPNLKKAALEASALRTKYLKSNFISLTLGERNQFWSTIKFWYMLTLPNFLYNNPDREFVVIGFDASLLSKGILLNSEMEFDKFLAETGNEALLKKYNEIKMLRLQLNKLYEKSIAEKWCDTDSLERRANELERELMYESKEFGDYTRNLSITWEDVRDNLKEKDAAIEFVHFPLNNDSTMYMAYVLRPNMDAPELVKLFEEKDLTILSDNEIYKSAKCSEMIWAKLHPYLEGIESVYFAPDGVLHQIGIEYIPDFEEQNKLISERYNLYRLSSTRQIVIKQQAKLSDRAVIYGGIQYDTDPDAMKIESAKYPPTKRGYTPWYNTADSISVRSRQGYLKHTLTEAQSLWTLFNDNNQSPTLFIGNEASEESFKSLSGQHNNIIHIATHGFYWDADDAEYEASNNERLLFMSQFCDNARRNIEDKALTRTGLFMAGANNALKGDTLPEGVDDGILTAQEIANLDLRGLDLVVLSACQTGMGDISGDGVFGLQRGFKKAGANTILMSLWDVSDEATQILMTNFYKNYLGGMSKQQSLREAQKAVRETPGFSDPEYWAAFILLDALN